MRYHSKIVIMVFLRRVRYFGVALVVAVSSLLTLFPGIAFAAYTCTGGGDHGGAAWDPATDCPGGIAGVHTNVGALTIGTGETATVQAYNGTSFGSVSITASSISVTGTLTADGKGYAGAPNGSSNGSGPGAGSSASGGGGAS